MNRTKLITSILLCLVYVGTSWGAEVSLFEQDFLRNKGKRDKYEETFAANEGEARLIISNGDEEGKNRVKRLAVFLNGKRIKKLSRLMKKNSRQKITVNLLAENTLSVKLAGKRQGHLKVQVIQDVDTDASSVDVTLFDKEYLRSKGRPDAFQDSFVGQVGEAKLIVRGVGESGKKKMRIASVSLNGEKIAGPRRLVMKGDQQEFTVNLLEENSVSVKLFGKPGRGLQVQVVQEVEAAAAAVVGPEGGVVAVEDTESPIYGAKIEVPAGALDGDIVLTMKPVELEQELPGNSVLAGPVVDFGPDRTQFNTDVVITLPYFDEDDNGYLDATGTREENVFPMVYNEETLEWEFPEKIDQDVPEKIDQDVVANTDSYAVSHFSPDVNGSNPKVKLGVVYSLEENKLKDCLVGNKDDCKYYKTLEGDIKKINLWIASKKVGETVKNNSVELVIQTEAAWSQSYPYDYNYLVEYVKILQEGKIKWTPLLGIHNVPDKLALTDKYKKDKIEAHWLPFRPGTGEPYEDIWTEVKPWVKGLVNALRKEEKKILIESFLGQEIL